MTFTVRPAADGGWLAFAAGARLLVVAATDEAFVSQGWQAITGPDGFQTALDLLTSKGLAATPPFLLVEWETGKDARVIVRGSIALSVTDAAGTQPLSAAGVSTWVERSLPGLSGIAVTVPGASPAGSVSLPLEHGVSLVAEVVMGGGSAKVPKLAAPVVVADVESTVVPEIDVEATVREPLEVAEPAAAEEGYDYLFGDTMYRSVADAAVREPEPEAAVDPAAGDHDGHTVLTSDIAKLRGKRRPRAAKETPKETPKAVAQKLVLVVSPSGAREALTQPILIGRNPSVSKVSGGQIPRLLTVGTADQDISRTHAQFALEGGTVVVTDLHSRNGTSIVLPGKSPQKLRAGEPTSVIVGTVVDFGGGVTVTVDEDA